MSAYLALGMRTRVDLRQLSHTIKVQHGMTHNAVHVEVEVIILLAIRIRTSNVNRYRYYAAVFSSDLGFVHLFYGAYYGKCM